MKSTAKLLLGATGLCLLNHAAYAQEIEQSIDEMSKMEVACDETIENGLAGEIIASEIKELEQPIHAKHEHIQAVRSQILSE